MGYAMERAPVDPLLNILDVQRVTSLSKATIYRFIAAGRFPKPVRLSPRGRVAWRSSHIRVWTNDPMDWDDEFFGSAEGESDAPVPNH
jgi:prophage regulatory protein